MHAHRARFPEDSEPQGRLPSESAIPDDLAVALSAAVPLHIEELRDLDPEILASVAHTAAPVVGSHGDDLLFGGKHCAAAFNALARGLAAAALTAWGGVSFAGMHWCAEQGCSNPAAPHAALGPERRGDRRP